MHDALGDAAHQHVRESGASVRAEHDQVHGFALRGVQDFKERRADFEQAARFEAGVAILFNDFVELALSEQALFLADAAHRADVHRGAEFRGHHHRRKRLIDVQENDLGAEFFGEFFGVAEGEIGVF